MAAYSRHHYNGSSNYYNSGNGGVAQRAVALDLMLRTFMNSPDFQPNNIRMWEGIAKLVPGTTVQQCIQRWEELKCLRLPRDITTLTARGSRPLSSSSLSHHSTANLFTTGSAGGGYYYRHEYPEILPSINDSPSRHYYSSSYSLGPPAASNTTANTHYDNYRNTLQGSSNSSSSSSSSSSSYRLSSGGKFTASFCQSYLNKRDRNDTSLITKATLYDNRPLIDHKSTSPNNSISSNTVTNSTTTVATTCTENSHHGNYTTNPTASTNAGFHSNASTASIHHHPTTATSTYRTVNSVCGSRIQIPSTTGTVMEDECSMYGCGTTTEPHVIITILDGAKRKTGQFYCKKELLLQHMGYFRESPELKRQQDAIHIGVEVHCDPSLFSWLMKYIKKGTKEGLMGEELTYTLDPPSLSPSNVLLILPYADFLKVDSLIEECLIYCHDHINEVLSNFDTIDVKTELFKKLTYKFSPLEIEKIEREQVKNKFYFHFLEKLFDPSFSHIECPTNASLLFKCKYCSRLMTPLQEASFQCSPNRLSVNKSGQITFKHKRDTHWSVDYYLQSLKDSGLNWREIFWRVWGKIMCLKCTECGQLFQCSSLNTCLYHPGHTIPQYNNDSNSSSSSGLKYYCCGQSTGIYSSLPITKNGCAFKDHTLPQSSDKGEIIISNILKNLRDVICETNSYAVPEITTHDCVYTVTNILHRESNQVKKREGKVKEMKKAITNSQSYHHDSSVIDNKQQHHSKKKVSIDTTATTTGPLYHNKKRTEEEDLSLSELEEDEEDEEIRTTPVVVVNPVTVINNKSSQHNNKVKKSKGTRHHSDKTISVNDWTWDIHKPVRWNQDMQRSQDEKRIDQIQNQLQQLSTTNRHTTSSSSTTNTTNSTAATNTVTTTLHVPTTTSSTACTGGGGIFALLENQFMSTNTVKTISNTLTGGIGRNRKQSFGKLK